MYISQTDELLFSSLGTFAVLNFYDDKTYIPRGLWGQWAAGFTDPLYRGGGSGWQGLAGLAVVLGVEGVSQ